MAYTIGSEKGKKIAKDLAIGSTYKASDGSTWKKNQDGSVSVTTSNGQKYDNAYKSDDYSVTLRQQIDAGVPYSYVQSTLGSRVGKALSDPSLYQYAYDYIYNEANNYIQAAKAQENQKNAYGDIEDFLNQYYQYNQQPTAPKSDPRIDEMLNQILNRDKFSYDVMNDPLYQQYAEMYRREGDRASRETMADAAAMAGGMNTYAMTAAQQANSYYNSQLNDVIPELYNLAYDKYLKDIDLQIQDLGLLQNMDDRQYARYRDTMTDWQNDRSFAYGSYIDALNQGNWLTTRDDNLSMNNRDFINNNFLTNREYNTNQADKELEISRDDEEKAYNRILDLIDRGVTTFDPELMKTAKLTQEAVNQMIADKLNKGKVKGKDTDYEGYEPTEDDYKDALEWENKNLPGSENYTSIEAACEEVYANEGKDRVLKFLGELYGARKIDQGSYMSLYKKYRG